MAEVTFNLRYRRAGATRRGAGLVAVRRRLVEIDGHFAMTTLKFFFVQVRTSIAFDSMRTGQGILELTLALAVSLSRYDRHLYR